MHGLSADIDERTLGVMLIVTVDQARFLPPCSDSTNLGREQCFISSETFVMRKVGLGNPLRGI